MSQKVDLKDTQFIKVSKHLFNKPHINYNTLYTNSDAFYGQCHLELFIIITWIPVFMFSKQLRLYVTHVPSKRLYMNVSP